MDKPKDDVIEVLLEIREILNRIYTCFEDEYLEIQKRKHEEKVESFKAALTEPRKKIFVLLLDQRHLSQGDIAKEVSVSQPAVSQFVKLLIEKDLIEQVEEAGGITYRDKNNLLKSL